MDFDHDGDTDILSGSWPGEIYLFRRESGTTFAKPEILKDADGKPIKLGSASAVFATDWDADGDWDLLVGNIDGHVYLVPNEGSRKEARFGRGRRLSAGTGWISVPHGDAGPIAADWDGDGKTDLLIGCGNGSVVWCRNLGTAEKPRLSRPRVLIDQGGRPRDTGIPTEEELAQEETEAVTGNPLTALVRALFPTTPPSERTSEPKLAKPADEKAEKKPEPVKCGTRAKICVADFNGDGRPDLLLGDFSMTTEQRPELSAEEKKAKAQAEKKWRDVLAEYRRLLTAPSGKTPEERKQRAEELEKITDRLIEAQQEVAKYRTVDYKYHGYVWLFLRRSGEKVAAENGGS